MKNNLLLLCLVSVASQSHAGQHLESHQLPSNLLMGTALASGTLALAGWHWYQNRGQIPEKHTWTYAWNGNNIPEIITQLEKDQVFAHMPRTVRTAIIKNISGYDISQIPLIRAIFPDCTPISSAEPYTMRSCKYVITRAGITGKIVINLERLS